MLLSPGSFLYGREFCAKPGTLFTELPRGLFFSETTLTLPVLEVAGWDTGVIKNGFTEH
jgi:hypothetical protein